MIPDGAGWRLVEAPSPPPQRAPETIGRAFREARRAGRTVREAAAIVGADEELPLDVVKVSFTSAETDSRRRRRKNQEALEAAIELSKKEAEEKKKVAASNASRHAQEQARAVRILAGKVDDNDEAEEDPYFAFRKRFKDDAAGGSGKSQM